MGTGDVNATRRQDGKRGGGGGGPAPRPVGWALGRPPPTPHPLGALFRTQRLALQQRRADTIQHLPVLTQELPGIRVETRQDTRGLLVDLVGLLLAVVLAVREVAPQEDVMVVLTEGDRANRFAHPE